MDNTTSRQMNPYIETLKDTTFQDKYIAIIVGMQAPHGIVRIAQDAAIKLAKVARECVGTPCLTCDGLTSRECHQCYKCDAAATLVDY